MTRFHYIIIAFALIATVAGILTEHSEAFVISYLLIIAAAILGVIAILVTKGYRWAVSNSNEYQIADKLKLTALVAIFVVGIPVAFVILDLEASNSPLMNEDSRYDSLRK